MFIFVRSIVVEKMDIPPEIARIAQWFADAILRRPRRVYV
jgi:hypothetical protein